MTVQLRDLMCDPLQGWGVGLRALTLVDLSAVAGDAAWEPLPLWPVIGIGHPTHPLAPRVDAVLEAPITLAGIVRQASAFPNAASTLVQLLRSIDGVEPERSLTQESLAYGALQAGEEHRAWLLGRAVAPSPAGQVAVAREGNVLSVSMNRPWAHNAIDRTMRDELHAAFTIAALDAEITRVDLRSTGDAFSIGGDLAEFGTTLDPDAAHRIRMLTLPARPMALRPEIYDVHVQGACVGAGLEIAAFAGRVTAAPSAWFQLPELAMGLIPGAGGCVSVPRRIGRQRAALLILSGRRISARTALDWGLIDAIEDHPAIDPGRADGDVR